MKKFIYTAALFFFSIGSMISQTTWTGFNSSDWNDAQNWTNGVPVSTTDVIIDPPLGFNFPIIVTPAYCNSLSISADSYLGFGASTSLEIHGDLINNSTFDAGNGTIVFAGQTQLYGPFMFHDIIINGTLKTLDDVISVSGNWTNNGIFQHNNGGINFIGNTTIDGISMTLFNDIGIYGSVTDNGPGIMVNGNWINNGSFFHNNGTVRFCGNTNQSLGITGVSSFYNLVIDNTVNGVGMVGQVSVSNDLILANGYLDLFTNKLDVLNASPTAIQRTNGYLHSESGPSAGYSFVNWAMNTSVGKYTIPFGTEDDFIPVDVEISKVGSGNGMIGIATYHTDEPNFPYPNTVTNLSDSAGNDHSSFVVNRFWIMSSSGFAIDPISNITFKAADAEIGTNDHLISSIWTGTNWVLSSQNQISLPSGVTTQEVNNYSIFILSKGPEPSNIPNGIQSTNRSAISVYPSILKSENRRISAFGIDSDQVDVMIVDMNGKTILKNQQAVFNGKTEVAMDMNSMQVGMYFLNISNNGNSSTHPFIVTQ